MKKHNVYLFLILLLLQKTYGQSDCYNSDFSGGNFTGWTGYTGTYNNPGQTLGIVPGQHTIITTQAPDPLSCGAFNMIPDGETQSCRLGDAYGALHQRLVYTVSVTPQTTLFIYKYALVLEDFGHPANFQPKFTIRILDQNGIEIDPLCGVYNVYANQPGQNFQTCDYNYFWKPWTTVALNLSSHIGQNLKIEFTSQGCGGNLHSGYAYITAKCAPLRANVAVCTGESNFTLSGPSGFVNYVWQHNGQIVGTGQNVVLPLSNYAIGDVFQCTLTSYSNGNACTCQIEGILGSTVAINPSFTTSTPCNNGQTTSNPISFIDQTSIQNSVLESWNWDFGDGTTSTEQNPSHVFLNSGTYSVKLTVTSVSGCSSTYTSNIVVNNNPIQIPNVNTNQIFCEAGKTIQDLNTNGNNVAWFDSLTSTTPLPSATIINDLDTYYCSLISNNCYGPRVAVNVAIKIIETPTGTANQQFCLIDEPTISSLVVNGLNIKWYADALGTIPLPLNTHLTNNTTYYAFQEDPITLCKSKSGLAVHVELLDDSNGIPDFLSKSFCKENNAVVSNLYFEGVTTLIYDSNSSTTPLHGGTNLADGGIYYAAQINATSKCENVKRTKITVRIYPCDVIIYNSITINNNNQNDYLAIGNIESFPNSHLDVFNRFGQIVYKSDNYGTENNLFYGEANTGDIVGKNKKLPTGTYYYLINFKNESLNIDKTKKGFIYILNNE